MMKKITVLVPCHNEEENLNALYNALTGMMKANNKYDWQILLIDDGSQDHTLEVMKALRKKDERVAYVSLSRNFGKEAAMLAGLDYASGDCAIVMDADLQHPVEVIPQMLSEWEKGYDDVYARRSDRGKESWLRRKLSMAYYRLLQKLAKIDILPNVGDFRLLDRKCIDALRQLRESERCTKGLYCWIGFRKKEISFKQGDRRAGKSSFNYHKLLNLAIEGITSYTTAPLRISTVMGLIVSAVAFIYMIYVLLKTLLVGEPVHGFPTLIIVILFLGGIQLVSIGIIGEYLGRIFNETKHRPVYLIREKEGI